MKGNKSRKIKAIKRGRKGEDVWRSRSKSESRIIRWSDEEEGRKWKG
jgi:hypothetical protein